MKINVEVEMEPEELRRLIGLPDAKPLWDAVNKRIADGDSEFLRDMVGTVVPEGLRPRELWSIASNFYTAFRGEEKVKASTEKTTTAPRPKAKRRRAPAKAKAKTKPGADSGS